MEMKETLTFDDIQIIPKFSDILTRKNCDLSTNLTPKIKLKIPIISSPMDTITEWEMIKELNKLGGIGILHRFMSIEEMIQHLIKADVDTEPIVVAIGTKKDEYWNRVRHAYAHGVTTFLIDVAHGHHKLVEYTIKSLKDRKSDIEIIAGSIATSDAAYDLINWGAAAVRVGLGNGCFTPEMKVKLGNNTYKSIKDISLGDKVYTHTGKVKEVINKFEFNRDEEIMEINGIECTKNHEFYVVHKKYKNDVTDDNIEEYAEWIGAKDLTNDYLLVEI